MSSHVRNNPVGRCGPRPRRTLDALAAATGIAAVLGLANCADFGSPFIPQVATVTIAGPAQRSVRTGEMLELSADVRDAAGHPIPGAVVEWSSSAPATAVLESRGGVAGRARAVAQGSAMVVARSQNVQSAPLRLLVVTPDAASVTITSPAGPMTLGIGQTAQFSAEVRDAGGSVMENAVLGWLSSNPGIISIDAHGLARGMTAGTVTVQAQSGEVLSAGVTVTVPAPAPSYAAVIQPIWNAQCTECHGARGTPDGNLNLAGNAYDRIVSVAAFQNSHVLRVAPGDPDQSYIVLKLQGCRGGGCIGGSMPPGTPLSSSQLQQIRDWILGGCPR